MNQSKDSWKNEFYEKYLPWENPDNKTFTRQKFMFPSGSFALDVIKFISKVQAEAEQRGKKLMAEEVREKLKHIAMFYYIGADTPKGDKKMPFYSTKDVLDILDSQQKPYSTENDILLKNSRIANDGSMACGDSLSPNQEKE